MNRDGVALLFYVKHYRKVLEGSLNWTDNNTLGQEAAKTPSPRRAHFKPPYVPCWPCGVPRSSDARVRIPSEAVRHKKRMQWQRISVYGPTLVYDYFVFSQSIRGDLRKSSLSGPEFLINTPDAGPKSSSVKTIGIKTCGNRCRSYLFRWVSSEWFTSLQLTYFSWYKSIF